MEGTAGGWKDFLTSYDKKFGSSLSDPARRSKDALLSFLKTFTKEDDLKVTDILIPWKYCYRLFLYIHMFCFVLSLLQK